MLLCSPGWRSAWSFRGACWRSRRLILLGAFTFAGIGLLVASRAKTLEAVSGLMNLVMLPMWVLSGIFFSSERFPDAAQPFIQALPLTPLIDCATQREPGGSKPGVAVAAVGILAAWGGGSFVLACGGSGGIEVTNLLRSASRALT